jgi:hypothetical protein
VGGLRLQLRYDRGLRGSRDSAETIDRAKAQDEVEQIYKNNDVALVWANYGQQELKSLKIRGAKDT